MLVYFLVFIGAGMIGAVRLAKRKPSFEATTLYIFVVATYVPLVAVYVSTDHRHAVGMHLILGCFAGAWLAQSRLNSLLHSPPGGRYGSSRGCGLSASIAQTERPR